MPFEPPQKEPLEQGKASDEQRHFDGQYQVGIGMCAMRLLYPDLILTVEVPLLITCFALLQWFLLSRLKRHYTTADLV